MPGASSTAQQRLRGSRPSRHQHVVGCSWFQASQQIHGRMATVVYSKQYSSGTRFAEVGGQRPHRSRRIEAWQLGSSSSLWALCATCWQPKVTATEQAADAPCVTFSLHARWHVMSAPSSHAFLIPVHPSILCHIVTHCTVCFSVAWTSR